MEKDFLIIAITRPDFFPSEAELINRILASEEADLVHIRKPNSRADEMESLLNKIDSRYHPLLKLHDHFTLAEKYNVGGIHLNSRNPIIPEFKGSEKLTISKSVHNIEDLKKSKELDYAFISPIFDSISKRGYKAAFNLQLLAESLKNEGIGNAVALGGVTPDKFNILVEAGFKGAALLGHFFM